MFFLNFGFNELKLMSTSLYLLWCLFFLYVSEMFELKIVQLIIVWYNTSKSRKLKNLKNGQQNDCSYQKVTTNFKNWPKKYEK